jgi:hypothetical protein
VTFDDWLLALHVLSAFALVAALVLFWILIVVTRNVDEPGPTIAIGRVAVVGSATIAVGTAGTILFGVWLAIALDAYQVWDGWVIAAIVLWALATVALVRSFVEYAKPAQKARALLSSGQTGPNAELAALNRTSTGLLLRGLASAAVVLIVIDMIYKPGA